MEQDHHRACNLRLYKEWDYINFTYRLKLERPLILLVELEGKWGDFDPVTYVIRLSQRLVTHYPWHMVVEVFKHEIAHIMSQDEIGAHGEGFKSACKRIGMSEWAMRSTLEIAADLQELSTAPPTTSETRVLERVRKLLSLATSANSFEALAAMKKARELCAKYNQEISGAVVDYHYATMATFKQRLESYYYKLSAILCDHFYVQVIFSSEYSVEKGVDHKTLEVHGTKPNVKMATYVYEFLLRELEELWAKEKGEKSARRRRSFYLGVLQGFWENLRKEAPVDDTGNALVVRKDPRLSEFVNYRFPKLTNVSRGRSRVDSRDYESGRDKGKKIVLRRPVESGTGRLIRLLTR